MVIRDIGGTAMPARGSARLTTALATAAATLALGLAVGARPLARADDDPAVKVASKPEVGSYLTDGAGRTLYLFKKDTQGRSACAGNCVTLWPIFFRERVQPAAGTKSTDFGTITREDGKKQTTYKGLPLYYFSEDHAPSDTKGQGFKDLWVVASP
jgi:predicted lipoprotein with Yx(FWY)xxD motif